MKHIDLSVRLKEVIAYLDNKYQGGYKNTVEEAAATLIELKSQNQQLHDKYAKVVVAACELIDFELLTEFEDRIK